MTVFSWLQTTRPTSGGAVTADTSCKLCRTFPPQQWWPDLPCFGQVGHGDPLDGWCCCSQKLVMSRPIQVQHLRCASIRQAQYTDTWTCHLLRESRLTPHTDITPLTDITPPHRSRSWSKPPTHSPPTPPTPPQPKHRHTSNKKTRTLRMNPTRTTIAHIAHSTTHDVASTHGTWILGNRARILVHIT